MHALSIDKAEGLWGRIGCRISETDITTFDSERR